MCGAIALWGDYPVTCDRRDDHHLHLGESPVGVVVWGRWVGTPQLAPGEHQTGEPMHPPWVWRRGMVASMLTEHGRRNGRILTIRNGRALLRLRTGDAWTDTATLVPATLEGVTDGSEVHPGRRGHHLHTEETT